MSALLVRRSRCPTSAIPTAVSRGRRLRAFACPVTDKIDVSVKYRYFNHANIDLLSVTRPQGRDGGPSRTASLLGVSYNFGGAAAAASAPAAASARRLRLRRLRRHPRRLPPPPPPVVQCAPGPYIVFFEWDKADITPDAASILDNAVSAYANCGSANVMARRLHRHVGHAEVQRRPVRSSCRRGQGYLTVEGHR